MSVVLTMAAPCGAAQRQTAARVTAYSGPTREQSKIVHRYERYLARIAEQRRKARRVVRFAYRQIGKPYRWGGAGPHSYDCSGLAMTAWRHAGIRLPHRADLQFRVIPRKVPFRHLRPGDLVFFSGAGHVGIYVGNGRFIHAPHTGTFVQRGRLTGWRRRAFFGAARPGSPAYRRWPRWVRRLAGRSPERVDPVRAPIASVAVADPARHRAPGIGEAVTPPVSVNGAPRTGDRGTNRPAAGVPAAGGPAPGDPGSSPGAAGASPPSSPPSTPPSSPPSTPSSSPPSTPPSAPSPISSPARSGAVPSPAEAAPVASPSASVPAPR